ncbi:carbohydrate esterase family 9 protein [Serpula lacrymans var. lacrymans S7.3]|uniref:Carbohydrate esterase family 9 protein n=2 Tax=Serpula lacrymans var. lacrymans TaxID=341189 RepID=F8QII6_SERL3|nr:carbohydrate esterase family 9 protein [Serpula lacrymans var. lacrymans S7.9]EGN91868.1 carbohydrate esterase family 9 protein [Serpula lacrymans var. lacrymans S7.3]EGO26296.1 carbohydrate esterase family 9 protein [Serpula lacrymans var. lacrymans S7.9]
MASESPNGLICFTNCLLPQEDGSLVQKDLWIDERRGVILDAQRTFFLRKERPDKIIDLGGNILSPGFIDIQINGGYGFDFSVYDGDDQIYRDGMKLVAEKIIETGVTALVPTIITQEKSLYPKLLHLLRPYSAPNSAHLLGWHAEGPFLDLAKRGAHAPPFLLPATQGFKSFEDIYGLPNLADAEDWLMAGSVDEQSVGVRIVTAAPEIEGVMHAVGELSKRGVVFSIGHSIATTDVATMAVQNGARLITHLFNAMPQLHHRDPSIIGLLGASPHLSSPLYSAFSPFPTSTVNALRATIHAASVTRKVSSPGIVPHTSEAFDDTETPPQSPMLLATQSISQSRLHTQTRPHLQSLSLASSGSISPLPLNSESRQLSRGELHLDKGFVADLAFERPFYEMIVDGIHSHPNSVRLAYSAYPEGCILITDAMKILDPNLRDGIHEWRDGQRFVKEGDKLYLEGTTTLAGSVVTLDKCVRNFSRFTGCSLGEAIKCATFNPAKCLKIENKKGTLRAGADADLVVLDRGGNVMSTWIKGKVAWSRKA